MFRKIIKLPQSDIRKMRLYLVRHGEKKDDSHGSSLTINGINQIEKLADYIIKKQFKIKTIYSSQLKRSIETCQILSSRLGVEHKESNIIEFKENLFYSENPDNIAIQNLERVKFFINQIIRDQNDVLLGFHAGINRAILHFLLDIPIRKTIHYNFDVASLSILEYNEKQRNWYLCLLNSTNHYQ